MHGIPDTGPTRVGCDDETVKPMEVPCCGSTEFRPIQYNPSSKAYGGELITRCIKCGKQVTFHGVMLLDMKGENISCAKITVLDDNYVVPSKCTPGYGEHKNCVPFSGKCELES